MLTFMNAIAPDDFSASDQNHHHPNKTKTMLQHVEPDEVLVSKEVKTAAVSGSD